MGGADSWQIVCAAGDVSEIHSTSFAYAYSAQYDIRIWTALIAGKMFAPQVTDKVFAPQVISTRSFRALPLVAWSR